MARYFVEIAYLGKHFHGWQKQPNAKTVQQTIEDGLFMFLGIQHQIVGCGRTDSGVHASKFFFHFDSQQEIDRDQLTFKLNRILTNDIRCFNVFEVGPEAHARYDAYERSYRYDLSFEKDPFRRDTTFHFPFAKQMNWDLAQQAADILFDYNEFYPFCKTHSGVDHYRVVLNEARWDVEADQAQFYISANRFLRGMVRLIVGACLNAGLGKVSLDQIRSSLDNQLELAKSWSVPAEGLFLTDIKYPAEIMPLQVRQGKV